MKNLVVLVLALVFMLNMSAQDNNDETDNFALIESQAFVFEANRLTAQNGFTKSLTSEYSLTIKGDSANAYLPYVGEAYSAPIGESGAVIFDNIMESFNSELKEHKKEKNNMLILSFKVKGEGGMYDCHLSVGKSGYASLVVIPSNKQSVSYSGNIEPLDKE